MLGRRGHPGLDAVSGMFELSTVQAGMQQWLPMTQFDQGSRYADYYASGDSSPPTASPR